MTRSVVQFFRVGDEWCVILVTRSAGQQFNIIGWAPGHLDMSPELAQETARNVVRAERAKLVS